MKNITAPGLKKAFVSFFEKRGHKEIPSVPVAPEGDSSALFISAGMHPLVPYLLGEVHPLGKRLVDVQECLRTVDIDTVGDSSHHTWFEMLGNWSLGDYFKKEALGWSWEFLTTVLGIKEDSLSVTCFAGDRDAPRDLESARIWKKLGVPEERIFFLPKKENWWGPVGEAGPCGPDSEIFIDVGKKVCSSRCGPWCGCGKYIEVWNNVFMEFNKTKDGRYQPLARKSVDTGMGLERMVAILNGFNDDYLTDIWRPIIRTIESLSGLSYGKDKNKKAMRIIADHIRAAVFVIADGIVPGNKEQGYVLRKLIRRSIRQGKVLGIETNFIVRVAEAVVKNKDNFGGKYPELGKNLSFILLTLEEEELRFRKTLSRGIKEIEALIARQGQKKIISGQKAFYLYESFGFPLEMIKEEALASGFSVDEKGFLELQKEHRRKSNAAAKGRFKGGLASKSAKVIGHHTATHLLQASLRRILGNSVSQAGSNLTEERLRFDFSYPERLSERQLKEVESLVNEKIKADLKVDSTILPLEEARKKGALSFFREKYPEKVKVYSIGNFSKEICAGPHVASTGKLKKFKIIKEESCGAGKRRIYAVIAG